MAFGGTDGRSVYVATDCAVDQLIERVHGGGEVVVGVAGGGRAAIPRPGNSRPVGRETLA
jgi:hypothetical protein